jgi:alpha-L-fucosidase
VRELQPDCLVSGRIGNEVGDYASLGDNEQSFGPIEGNWETPCTLNDTWGFKPHDTNWKSVDYLVRLLVNCASLGVNYLLNVGPDARGVIPAASANRLRGVGRWLKANGEAIYGTRRNPFPHDFPWGTATCRKGAVYLHFTAWPRGPVGLRGLRNRVKGARLLSDGNVRIEVIQRHRRTADEHELELLLPRRKPAGRIPVIALDITGEPDVDVAIHQQPEGAVYFSAHCAILKGQKAMKIHRDGSVIHWTSTRGSIRWPFVLHDPGTFRVILRTAMDRDRKHWFGTHDIRVAVGRRAVRGKAGLKDMVLDERVNRWHVGEADLGPLALDTPGRHELVLRVEKFAKNAPAGFTPCGVRLVKKGSRRNGQRDPAS